MSCRTNIQHTLALVAATLPLEAWTHDGHGLGNILHGHATDFFGFVLAIGVAALILHATLNK